MNNWLYWKEGWKQLGSSHQIEIWRSILQSCATPLICVLLSMRIVPMSIFGHCVSDLRDTYNSYQLWKKKDGFSYASSCH